MIARSVNEAAAVIQAAQRKGVVTPAGLAVALDACGALLTPDAKAELERLRSLLNAQPAELTEAQIEALADTGNGAVNDYFHERACSCSEYPEECATDAKYRKEAGFYDSGAFEIGMGAVIGLWESMREDSAAEELGRLRARVAELEAERHSTNGGACCEACGHYDDCIRYESRERNVADEVAWEDGYRPQARQREAGAA